MGDAHDFRQAGDALAGAILDASLVRGEVAAASAAGRFSTALSRQVARKPIRAEGKAGRCAFQASSGLFTMDCQALRGCLLQESIPRGPHPGCAQHAREILLLHKPSLFIALVDCGCLPPDCCAGDVPSYMQAKKARGPDSAVHHTQRSTMKLLCFRIHWKSH